jgi:hypothetical protein
MSQLLQEYSNKEKDIERLKRELEMLQSSPKMKMELEFKQKLEALMREFDKRPNDILSLLNQDSDTLQKTRSSRSVQPFKLFTNPHTGEKVKAKSTNNKKLREWKEKHGADEVDSWGVILD